MEGHQATSSRGALAGRGTNLAAGATMRRPASRGVPTMCILLLTLGLGLRRRAVPGRVTGAVSDSMSTLGPRRRPRTQSRQQCHALQVHGHEVPWSGPNETGVLAPARVRGMALAPQMLRDLGGRIKPQPLSGVTGFLQLATGLGYPIHVSPANPRRQDGGRCRSQRYQRLASDVVAVHRPLVLIRPPYPSA